jgi:hypothetical protein
MKTRALREAILRSKLKPAMVSKMSHVGQARIYQLLDGTVPEQNIRFSTRKRLAVALAPSIESDAHTLFVSFFEDDLIALERRRDDL